MLSKRFILLVSLLLVCNLLILIDQAAADPVETFETNLNMTLPDIIMIIISCGCIVIVAFDSRIALMIAFILYTSVFIVFTEASAAGYTAFNPYYSGSAMMICFALICISLLVTYKKSNTPLNVV